MFTEAELETLVEEQGYVGLSAEFVRRTLEDV